MELICTICDFKQKKLQNYKVLIGRSESVNNAFIVLHPKVNQITNIASGKAIL